MENIEASHEKLPIPINSWIPSLDRGFARSRLDRGFARSTFDRGFTRSRLRPIRSLDRGFARLVAPCSSIQALVRAVHYPGVRRWTWDLARRMVGGDNKHLRGFACELLMLVPGLLVVSSMVLQPTDTMGAHVMCLQMMYTIQVLILAGNNALPYLTLLDDLLDAHHDLFMTLYPRCAKPKLHYARHMARLFRKFQCVVTCFSAERSHRRSKRVANYAHKNVTKTIGHRLFLERISAFEDSTLFQGIAAQYSKREIGRWKWMLSAAGLQAVQKIPSLRIPGAGWIIPGDFVLLRMDTAHHARCSIFS